MTVFYLLVARAGSKRIPGKNLRLIHGRSLIAYKALAMRQAQSCQVVRAISTDSDEMAREANYYLSMSYIHRPPELATDTATTEDVVRHALLEIEKIPALKCDAVMLLEPSSPFVRPCDYDAAMALMEKTGAPFVFGEVLYLFRWDYLTTRHDLYDNLDGAVYYSMPSEQAIDIDTLPDLEHAERLAKHNMVDVSWTK